MGLCRQGVLQGFRAQSTHPDGQDMSWADLASGNDRPVPPRVSFHGQSVLVNDDTRAEPHPLQLHESAGDWGQASSSTSTTRRLTNLTA
jgi:hypothetical protein